MPFAAINGFRLYHEIQGQGDIVMLLHHGFGCTKMWGPVVALLVDQGYKVIMYDRRGFGQSDRGADFMDFYVSDDFRSDSVKELEALRHWLGIDSFHLVGQCEGGVVAIDYAVQYPQRVKDIVISSTMCYSTIPLSEFNAGKFTKAFDELHPDQQKKFIDWHGEFTRPFFHQFRQFGGEYGKDLFDLRPALDLVDCPTLVLYPDRSVLFAVEQGVAFYRHLSKGELAVLPNCGHNTYEEQPEQYASHVSNFLGRHRFGDQTDMKMARPVTCAG